jgi:hypothetical protein
MSDYDPNEAYEVAPIEPGPHGPPEGWWTVRRNGMPVRYFPGKEKAERFATDPEYRASHSSPEECGRTRTRRGRRYRTAKRSQNSKKITNALKLSGARVRLN